MYIATVEMKLIDLTRGLSSWLSWKK